MGKEITLKIHESAPDKITQKRLVKYLDCLTKIYGETNSVHFSRVEKGSACLKSLVDDESYSTVLANVKNASSKVGGKRQIKAYSELNHLLHQDGCTASILTYSSDVLAELSGLKQKPGEITIDQPTTVQGLLYYISGKKDNEATVRLENDLGESVICTTTRALASKLGGSLWKYVRMEGTGRWLRSDGEWVLESFRASSYKILSDNGLGGVASSLSELLKLTNVQQLQEEALKDRH